MSHDTVHPNRHRFTWTARYADGTLLPQFDDLGMERSILAADPTQTVEIMLVERVTGFVAFRLQVNPGTGEQFVKRWRHDIDANTGQPIACTDVLGLMRDGVATYVIVKANGAITISSNPDAA